MTNLADSAKITAAIVASGYPHEVMPDGWLVNGEANPILRALIDGGASVDGIVVDPPWMAVAAAYPTSAIAGGKRQIKTSGKNWSEMLTLKMAFESNFQMLRQLQNDTGAAAFFCGTVSAAMFTQIAYEYWNRIMLTTWAKGKGRVCSPFKYLPEYVLFCAVAGIHKPWDMPFADSVFDVAPVPVAERVHPAEKPVALLQTLARLTTPPDGVVLDCFAGSMSCMRAARNCRRRFLMIEADAELYRRGIEKARKDGVRKPLL